MEISRNREYKNKISERKIWFFEKHQQIEKPLVRLTKKKERERDKIQILKLGIKEYHYWPKKNKDFKGKTMINGRLAN